MWNADGGDDGAINAIITRIADDADDLTPGGTLCRDGRVAILTCETRNAQLPAQGIGRGEIARRESMIDDRNEVSAGVFIRIPHAALKQRDSEGSEILLADQHHTGLWLLVIAISVDVEGVISARIGWRGIGTNSNSGDSRD